MATASTTIKLEDGFLTCGICLKSYTKPKALQCLHTFCEECLIGYAKNAKNAICCPMCRDRTPMPPEGAKGLKTNFLIHSLQEMEAMKQEKVVLTCDNCLKPNASAKCFECNDNLCTPCSDAHKLVRLTRDHKVVSYDQLQTGSHDQEYRTLQTKCHQHGNEMLQFFCRKCEIPICMHCHVLAHSGHACVSIDVAGAEYVPNVRRNLQECTAMITRADGQLALINGQIEKLAENKMATIEATKETGLKLRTLIEYKETILLSQLETLVSEQSNDWNTRKSAVEKHIAALTSVKHTAETLLSQGNHVQILSMAKDIKKQVIIHQKRPSEVQFTKKVFNFIEEEQTPLLISSLGSISIQNVTMSNFKEVPPKVSRVFPRFPISK